MRGRLILGLLSASLLNTSAQSTPPPFGGNRNLHVSVDFNYITKTPNYWQATGAFTDNGTISHGTNESFRGYVAKVTDSPEGQAGSFTWSFSKAYTESGGSTDIHQTHGSWKMISGTGAYFGISGSGTMNGWYNSATGDIHDEFDGTVDCPNC